MYVYSQYIYLCIYRFSICSTTVHIYISYQRTQAHIVYLSCNNRTYLVFWFRMVLLLPGLFLGGVLIWCCPRFDSDHGNGWKRVIWFRYFWRAQRWNLNHDLWVSELSQTHCGWHGSLNVPIEHHRTIRYMVYNGYYKVMSNSPKNGHLPIPGWWWLIASAVVVAKRFFVVAFFGIQIRLCQDRAFFLKKLPGIAPKMAG